MIWLYRLLFPFVLRGRVALLPAGGWQAGRLRRRVLAPLRAAAPGPAEAPGGPPGLAAGGERGRDARDRARSCGRCSSDGHRGRADDDDQHGLPARARAALRATSLGVAYFPIDWWPFSARAWARIAPDLAIVTEGERWPEHMRQAANRGVPVVCINARISDRSFRRLARFPAGRGLRPRRDDPHPRRAPSRTRRASASSGFPPDRIAVTGNIKLDVEIPLLDAAIARVASARAGPSRRVARPPRLLHLARRGGGARRRPRRGAGEGDRVLAPPRAAARRAPRGDREAARPRPGCRSTCARGDRRRDRSTSRSATRPANCAR